GCLVYRTESDHWGSDREQGQAGSRAADGGRTTGRTGPMACQAGGGRGSGGRRGGGPAESVEGGGSDCRRGIRAPVRSRGRRSPWLASAAPLARFDSRDLRIRRLRLARAPHCPWCDGGTDSINSSTKDLT